MQYWAKINDQFTGLTPLEKFTKILRWSKFPHFKTKGFKDKPFIAAHTDHIDVSPYIYMYMGLPPWKENSGTSSVCKEHTVLA